MVSGSPKPFDPACIFCRITAGRAPASVVCRDEVVVAFMDIRPVNAAHLLVVPLGHAVSLADLPAPDGRRMFTVAQQMAAALRRSGLRREGANLFLADGVAAGQDVLHVHMHVLPRFEDDNLRLTGFAAVRSHAPPPRADIDEVAAAIRDALGPA